MSDVSARPDVSGAPVSLDGVTELRPPTSPAMQRFIADLPGDGDAPVRRFPPPHAVALVHTAVAVQLLLIDAGCSVVIAAAERVRRWVAPDAQR